ncbi:MAG: TetR/AcrR family transcriptional regulator [Rhizobiaceae bacterium]
MRKGEATRERILEIAEAAVLAKGFEATSIEEIIAEAGITKSGFFYHFRDKNVLARDLLRRYVEADDRIFDEVFHRAAELADDPLQRFLIGLKMLAEIMENLPGGHPGCLVASICYQERLFDREVVEYNRRSVEGWNARFRGYLDAIVERYPQRDPVDLDALAEMFSCVVDGGIIMAKVLDDPSRLARQVLAYRSFIKLQFSPATAAADRTPAFAAA